MIVRHLRPADFKASKLVKPTLDRAVFDNRIMRQAKGELLFLGLEQNMQLVCFVLLKWSGSQTQPDYPDLEDLFTRQGFRRRGHAAAIIHHAEVLAKQLGHDKLGVASRSDASAPERRLYQKLGYEPVGSNPYLGGVVNGQELWLVDLEKAL